MRLRRENSNVSRMQNRNYTSASVQSQLRLVQDRAPCVNTEYEVSRLQLLFTDYQSVIDY